MNILGISAFYHSSSASLVINGEIVAAAEEERFSRIKHDKNFPIRSINFCLDEYNLKISDIDLVAYYEKPNLKFSRILNSYISNFPIGFKSYFKVMPKWLESNLFFTNKIKSLLRYKGEIYFCDHHMSHMASAYFPSPYLKSTVISMDGVGEWTTLSIGYAEDNRIKVLKKINFPHSLGLLYSAFTMYCGFKVNSGEYKLMGLAPYGDPIYVNKILSHLINLKEDGSFSLNMKFFEYDLNENMISRHFENFFNKPRRNPESEITKFYMDIAASIQKTLEIILIKIINFAHSLTKSENLCLAGGVALNCVANAKILNEANFKNIWIQPASGDSGGSIGCALNAWYQFKQKPKKQLSILKDYQFGSYLGNSYKNEDILKFLKQNSIKFSFFEDEKLTNEIANYLSCYKVVGRFSGKMEFGPRALGNRSILANPLDINIQEKLNLKIKFRENFRPFAPAVLKEKVNEYFKFEKNSNLSPYMLFTAQVKGHKPGNIDSENWRERLKNNYSPLPGITHVDGSARIQTVDRDTNYKFYMILNKFFQLTNCPVLINTSFNIRGEPIVESPKDALNCFINTGIDILVLENYIIKKEDMELTKINSEYLHSFELD